MSIFQEHRLLVAAVVALIPAALSRISGRALVARMDEATLPERLQLHRRRNTVAMILALAADALLAPRALLWTGPLAFTTLLLSAYPLRRRLFGETWGPLRYLSFFIRLFAGLFGFWLVLAAAPAIASLAGSFDWLAGLALGAALMIWDRRYADGVRICLGATPLAEGPIRSRCQALADSAGMTRPDYLLVTLHGGAVANALALPSLRGNAVVFTDTLLARLGEAEIAAICAHELAHFEYFSPQRLRRMRAVSMVLIAAAAALAPLGRLLGMDDSPLPSLLWLSVLTLSMVIRARDKQRQETVCDQRAIALTGDGEALVSALTKIYAFARMPRRIESRQEQASSHPSLSRRIRDIRKAAGTAPAHLTTAVTVPSTDGAATVTFDRQALNWTEQAGVTHVLGYAHLVELRLELRGRVGPRLRAATANGRRWDMPVALADVPRIQELLDRVDGQLADAPANRGIPEGLGRLFVMFTSMLALALGQVALSVVALLAWLAPATPLLAAAGVAAITAAALAVRDRPGTAMVAVAPVVACAGVVLLWLAYQARQNRGRSPRPLITLLAALALILSASLTVNGLDPIHLHLAARATPSAVVLWLALAAAQGCSPKRRGQLAGAAGALLAIATMTISSQTFIDRLGRDPFLVESPELRWTIVRADRSADYEIAATTARIQLSPGGLRIAALQQSESEEDAPTYQVGIPGESLEPVSGRLVRFLDDRHLVIADEDADGTTLRQILLDGSQRELWRQRVPHLRRGSLSMTRGSDRWRITGFDPDDAIVHAEGTIGTSELRERRWPARYTRDALIDAVTADGREPLVVETAYNRGLFERLPASAWMLGMLINAGALESRYWSIGDDGVREFGSSRLGASCAAGMGDGALACTVYDGTRTRLIRLAADTGAVTGLGWLDGRFAGDGDVADGWLTGWVGATAVAIDLVNGQVVRLPRTEGAATHLSVSADRLAAIVYVRGGYRLRIYAIGGSDGELARAR